MQELYTHSAATGSIEIHKVLRNTYMLLSMTLIFSAATAAISTAIGIGFGFALVMDLIAMGLLWFVLPKTANSSSGLAVVFAFTGLLGAGLGPLLNHYLAMSNGSGIVLQALAGTAFVFLGLSAYAITTRKDFSFLRGFIAVGVMIMLGTMLLLIGASLFGYNVSGLHLAFSAGVVLLMSVMILYQTSEIIHGGETNYLLATVSLYLSILNLFISLLRLIGAASDE